MHTTLRAALARLLALNLPALTRRTGQPVRRAARGCLLIPVFDR
ncbi:hypothetical protein [Pigmentiphaga litoralis]